MKKIVTSIFLLVLCLNLNAQWDIANGIVDWTPDNSLGMPAPGFFHNVVIVASLNVTISGGANVQDINGNSNYPLCPGAKTTLIFSLSGGATFSGASANDAVSTSGDWEGRFTWSYSLGKTVLTAVQNTTIPTNVDPGTFNTFSFNVLTPNYSSNFTFSTQIIKGTGTPDCRVMPGNTNDRDPNTTTLNDAQSINGFTNRSLPIQLFQLNSLTKKSTGLNVEWKTLNEQNTLEFEIERKYSNEETWMTIGKTPAAGQSSKELTYSYNDATYAQRDKIYYRIKQVDIDATFTYTDIKGIELKKNSQVKLDGYPNPVKDLYHLTITGAKDDKVSIDVFDILGRSVSRKTLSIVKGSNYHDLNMGTYTPGTYIVRVSSAEINESMTVVKVD
ncbi:MAG: T9SS type A sorting domain-containing protein [Saprospiraceae bacterium]|nr:T9SS type A sorting domain-containing protein [Saprospiraceae bacterium]